ncbi:MAG: D-aminoacyl-tRNA deacylase [Treponema sp.]|jgi:D-tyrosyl-tRNA(Tyr) deacylase|nr:D-aminoacyl-tRNA deacylase [Treponema sp.]
MKAVIQRVLEASVSSEGRISGRIDRGLLVYLGVGRSDTEEDVLWMAEKTVNLRIFNDEKGVMNLSIRDLFETETGTGNKPNTHTDGIYNTVVHSDLGILAVSQFTLLADARKGRRPYYGEAADPEMANKLYEFFITQIRKQGIPCESGVFRTHMAVTYTNDGPVTILLDSRS